MEKSMNVFLEEEIVKLKNGLIGAVNQTKLPPAVAKLVIETAARDILQALNKLIADDPEMKTEEES